MTNLNGIETYPSSRLARSPEGHIVFIGESRMGRFANGRKAAHQPWHGNCKAAGGWRQ
jgi:hypothetical protein